jgi:RimJ/RimL family protein N-acetyltransferase
MAMPPLLHITEPIALPRVFLRPFVESDLAALHDIQSRPEVARYLYWEPRTLLQSGESLERKLGLTRIEKEGDTLSLAVTLRKGGPVIGDVILTYASAVHRQAEVGYIFHPDAHGQGLATQATGAMVDLGFRALGVHRVSAHLDSRNTRSARLLERLGMRREARLAQNEWVKGEWTDDVIYAVLADEWAARRLGAP